MIWESVLSICVIASIGGGLIGLMSGWRVSRDRGADELMHYPPPFIWMRSRLLSARWVMRLGAMYVLSGAILGLILLYTPGDQTSQATQQQVCERLQATLTKAAWSPDRWTTRMVPDHHPGCAVHLVGPDDVRWFTIRSFPPSGMIGEQYRHHTVELERLGMALKPVTRIGDRAILATPRSKVVANPTLVMADENGTHTLEMNVQRVVPQDVVVMLQTSTMDSM
jgi:hypothetical protein